MLERAGALLGGRKKPPLPYPPLNAPLMYTCIQNLTDTLEKLAMEGIHVHANQRIHCDSETTPTYTCR